MFLKSISIIRIKLNILINMNLNKMNFSTRSDFCFIIIMY